MNNDLITQELRNQVIQRLSTTFTNQNHNHRPEIIEDACFRKSDGNRESYLRLCNRIMNTNNRSKQAQPASSSAALIAPTNNQQQQQNHINAQQIRMVSMSNDQIRQSTNVANNLVTMTTIPNDSMNALQNMTAIAGNNNDSPMIIQQCTPNTTNQQPQQIVLHQVNLQGQQNNQTNNIQMNNMRIAQPVYNNQIRPMSQSLTRGPMTFRVSQPQLQQQSTPVTINTIQQQPQQQQQQQQFAQLGSIRMVSPKMHVQHDPSNVSQGPHIYSVQSSLQQQQQQPQQQQPITLSNNIVQNVVHQPKIIGTTIYQSNQSNNQDVIRNNQSQSHFSSNRSCVDNIQTIKSVNTQQTQQALQPNLQQQQQQHSTPNKSNKSSKQEIPPEISPEELKEVKKELLKLRDQYLKILTLAVNTENVLKAEELKYSKVIITVLEGATTMSKPLQLKNVAKLREVCRKADLAYRTYLQNRETAEIAKRKKMSCFDYIDESLKLNLSKNSSNEELNENVPAKSLDIAFDSLITKIKSTDPEICKKTKQYIISHINTKEITKQRTVTEFPRYYDDDEKSKEDDDDFSDLVFDNGDDENENENINVKPNNGLLKTTQEHHLDENGLLRTDISTDYFHYRFNGRLADDLKSVSKEFKSLYLSGKDSETIKLSITYLIDEIQLPEFTLILKHVNKEYFVNDWNLNLDQYQIDNCVPQSNALMIIKSILEYQFNDLKQSYGVLIPIIFIFIAFKKSVKEALSQQNSTMVSSILLESNAFNQQKSTQ